MRIKKNNSDQYYSRLGTNRRGNKKNSNPARGQLNREMKTSLFPFTIIWYLETGSTVPSRVSPFIPHIQTESGMDVQVIMR